MLNKKIFLLLSLAAYATCSGHGEHSEKEKSNTAGTSGVISEDTSVDTPGEIEEPSTLENINLDDVQWERTFELYNKDGLIGPKELQELIFIEFNGFLFINQAETCIKLINSNGINKLELEQLKKFTPILHCLTKAEIYERFSKINNIHPMFSETFIYSITDKVDAIKLFLSRGEISELFIRHGQTEIGPIEEDKIDKMLFGSFVVALLQEIFITIDKDKDGRISANDLVKAVYDSDSETAAKKSDLEKLANELFTAGDLNGDGSMCFYEFMVAMVRDTQKAQDKLLQIPEEKMETSN